MVVVQDPLVHAHVPDPDLDHVVGRAPVQEAVAVLVATAVVVPVLSQERTRSPSPSLNPNLPSVVVHAQNPRIGRAASVPEVTDPDPDQEANIARAVVALVRL